MSDYYIFKLKSVDLHDRVNRFPPDFEFNFDFAYLIMHFILEQMANKIESGKNPYVYESFNPLSSKILQPLNRDYRNHIRYLGENFPSIGNILERENYREGKSYSYRFRPYYYNHQLEPYLITNSILLKKLKIKDSLILPDSVKKNCSFLVKYFDSNRLTIMFKEALDLNSDELEEEGKLKTYLSNAFKILKIKNGNFYMSHNPETDGRFHSNITGFPKKFRRFLRYDEEKMVEIDISASVPTFLYYLLTNYKSSNIHINNIINKKIYYNHYMLVKNSACIDIKEIQEFGEKILKGELYNIYRPKLEEFYVLDETYHQWQFNEFFYPESSFKNYYKIPRPTKPTLTESKTVLLSMLNSKSGVFELEELGFRSLFPTIFDFLKTFKKPCHRNFSFLILQTESYFMLNIIARRINNKFKRKLPFLTLHDCIITTESKINQVKDFMEKTFENELGFIPVMKTKEWV